MPPEFNRSERRALVVGTALVLAGAAARLGLGPDEATWAWTPAGGYASATADLADLRDAVAGNRARAARAATPLAADEKLDPNRAPEVELRRLPGVGPVLARALVEHRRAMPFRRRDDLLGVRGIGPATLRRIAPHLDLPDGPGGPPGGGRVDLNRAARAELEALPGVGPVLAGRILDLRRRRGRFDRVDDLLEVSGIGPARLEDLRPRVTAR